MKTMQEINLLSLKEIFDILDNELKIFSKEHYSQVNSYVPQESNLSIRINIENWSFDEKEQLFKDILEGTYYFYFYFTKQKVFDAASLISVRNAIQGNSFVFVNKKAIKWFSSNIRSKLKSEGYVFRDFEINFNKYSSSGYEGKQTYSRYTGSYAQDVMHFSDQIIDDAFEGDPDLYWNID
jgi:hypothetical protein